MRAQKFVATRVQSQSKHKSSEQEEPSPSPSSRGESPAVCAGTLITPTRTVFSLTGRRPSHAPTHRRTLRPAQARCSASRAPVSGRQCVLRRCAGAGDVSETSPSQRRLLPRSAQHERAATQEGLVVAGVGVPPGVPGAGARPGPQQEHSRSLCFPSRPRGQNAKSQPEAVRHHLRWGLENKSLRKTESKRGCQGLRDVARGRHRMGKVCGEGKTSELSPSRLTAPLRWTSHGLAVLSAVYTLRSTRLQLPTCPPRADGG